MGKLLAFLTAFIIAVYIGYLFISLVSFAGHKGREDYHWVCLYEAQGCLANSLKNIEKFPDSEKELNELINAKQCRKRHYQWKIRYRLIEKKENEVIFLLIIDSTKNFDFLTYKGLVTSGLGKARKDEKGEWHGTIEWIFTNYSTEKEF